MKNRVNESQSMEKSSSVKEQCVSAASDDCPSYENHIRKTPNNEDNQPLVTTTTTLELKTYRASIPQDFKTLDQLRFDGILQNCVAVISDVTAAKKTRNDNHFVKIFMVDPTQHQTSYEMMWFARPDHFPNIYRIGEIVLFKQVKCQRYQDTPQMMKNYETKICVIPHEDDPDLMKEARYSAFLHLLMCRIQRYDCELHDYHCSHPNNFQCSRTPNLKRGACSDFNYCLILGLANENCLFLSKLQFNNPKM